MPPPGATDRLTPPPPAAVALFREDVVRLVGRTPGARDPFDLALAVSGGPDSMAMLALAVAAFPGRVACATVDHRLRPGSGREAAMVAETCATIGVSHGTLYPDEAITGGNVHKQAREARYAAMARWAGRAGAGFLLTAHHADDQAETLLMRLNRASGMSGLSCIRPYRTTDEVTLLRPLLGWRRAELRAIVETGAWPFVDDPSNADLRYDRTAVRALLAARPELDTVALAASAAHIAEAEAALMWHAGLLWSERWNRRTRSMVLNDLPREFQRRLARHAIDDVRRREAIVRPPFSASSNVEPLLDAIAAGRSAVQGGILMRPVDGSWHFSPAPPRRSH